ncbi:MAG: bifunctional riboflavin kinase/FAD synthetase [Planctomycetota bacterium]|jgi:riboflavin kinase/FMN adenylyltransferase
MRIIEETSDLQTTEKGGVLTIGNFDGVHLGHQEILNAAKKAAEKRQTPLTAMTFDPHPVAVLKPDKSPGVLTPLNLKSHYLAQAGVDCLIVLKSTPELLSLSADDFVDRFLLKTIAPAVVIEGHDFNFGRARTGNIDKLQYLGAEKGFEVCIVEPRNIELSTGQTIRVSSTMIRDLLEGGAAADAALALGRPYRLIGRVIPGHGKGRQLGFPTANLQPTEQITPAHGVYAGRVEIGDSDDDVCQNHDKIPAALSIGHAPTLAADRPQLIEAHLLMENVPDLTGKFLAMDFIKHLRAQQKFDSEEHLAAQIANDCRKAKQVLAAHGSN